MIIINISENDAIAAPASLTFDKGYAIISSKKRSKAVKGTY
jgi:hypothetical protein